MTTEEFSNEFDVLILHTVGTPIDFDEYEKSVFLTKAQEELVKAHYTGSVGILGDSFETTEEARRQLSSLVKTTKLDPIGQANHIGVSEDSYFFKLPKEVWYITYESANVASDSNCYPKGKEMTVTPVSQDQYHKIKNNPFRGANNRQVIRLDIEGNIAELISKTPINNYTVRYVSKPTPIVLTNISEDYLTINDESTVTECTLHESLHRQILAMAVTMAIASKVKSKDS